ncbi:unnamed protein product [Symbiodinium sp. CCMP2592]|nr:unnamed protein product [Symbiodinium sp. CCMP2592]
MFLQAVLLLGIISSAGHRPADSLQRSLTPPQEGSDVEDVVPGKIVGVEQGGQASQHGLQVGEHIVKVGPAKYSILGLAILVSLPLIVRSAANGTVEVSQPVMFVILGAVLLDAFGHMGTVVLNWGYLGLGAKMFEIAFPARVGGIVMGCIVCGIRSPLPTELREDMAAEFGRLRIFPLLLFVLSVCFQTLKAWARHGPTSIAESDGTQLLDIMLKLLKDCALIPAQRDGRMDLEVQAVEEMLRKVPCLPGGVVSRSCGPPVPLFRVGLVPGLLVLRSPGELVNDEQGWGIPVSSGFVLTKEMLQVIGLRLLLAATLIKTFLDTELGIQDLEDCVRLASTHLLSSIGYLYIYIYIYIERERESMFNIFNIFNVFSINIIFVIFTMYIHIYIYVCMTWVLEDKVNHM